MHRQELRVKAVNDGVALCLAAGAGRFCFSRRYGHDAALIYVLRHLCRQIRYGAVSSRTGQRPE